MRTLFRILGLVALLSTSAIAQEFKPFRVGLGFGLVTPQQSLPGYLLYVEPTYKFPRYSIGFRLETVGRPDADIGILGSYTINGQYYFREGPTGFFGGLGFGVYTVNSALLGSCTCEDELKSTVMGFYPRIGYQRKRMTITIDFNIVQSAKQKGHSDVPSMSPVPTYYQATTSYIALKLGWYIGGGRKKKDQ